jgi:hypothetical protein
MNDPYYSPMLALDGSPFSALAWPPRRSGPRQPIGIAARRIPSGYYYRLSRADWDRF